MNLVNLNRCVYVCDMRAAENWDVRMCMCATRKSIATHTTGHFNKWRLSSTNVHVHLQCCHKFPIIQSIIFSKNYSGERCIINILWMTWRLHHCIICHKVENFQIPSEYVSRNNFQNISILFRWFLKICPMWMLRN